MSERRLCIRRRALLKCVFLISLSACLSLHRVADSFGQDSHGTRRYANQLTRIADPQPILADHPEFIQPVVETMRYQSPCLVDDERADLHVRAWRFSYNARGIVEMPNRLRADRTAVIMVHPWGVDDGQGWNTPEPAGAADFCTVEKNHLAGKHTREVINPFLKELRDHVACTLYSLPGNRDPIRHKLYRSFGHRPTAAERKQGANELKEKLTSFDYRGQNVPASIELSANTPVIDYFRQFSGLDAGARFNNVGFWDLPIPVTRDIDVHDDDIVIYDSEGYEPLKKFLKCVMSFQTVLDIFTKAFAPKKLLNQRCAPLF